MEKTKLTVIVDNIPQGDIKGEWGLSILVEYKDKKILVDTGASSLFAENMKKLGFCIEDVDYADRIEFATGDYRLCDGVYLIPHKTPGVQEIGKREMMYLKTPQGFVPDNFSHEQSLVIDTDKGLVTVRRRERTT